MQLTPTETVPTPVARVAEHYRPDLLALGASDVVALPKGVLVQAPDAERGTLLASVLNRSPHDVRMQVAVGTTSAEPAALAPAAVAQALAGAKLAGTVAVSFSERGTLNGMRIRDSVRVHVTDEARAKELGELLNPRVGGKVLDPDAGVALRPTTDAPPTSTAVYTVIPVG